MKINVICNTIIQTILLQIVKLKIKIKNNLLEYKIECIKLNNKL
jgi:hypothetical protein